MASSVPSSPSYFLGTAFKSISSPSASSPIATDTPPAPKSAKNVRREAPSPGDIVILLGGRTGRDGCGGATGSSKSHTLQSLESCGAEVQKGNAPEERKLQRLFRNSEASRLIKRCNDFAIRFATYPS